MMIEIEKENRVHDEVWRFLEDSLEDYQQGIETWMEKYDNDMDEHEQAVQTIQVETEQQKEEYQRLLDKYNARQQEMEDYKEHKLQAQREAEELERRTQAAIKIQSWWRGIMFRKGLGPFRRKKGKGKRGGSAKHSAKKKKK
jgi:predicted  nucleic acid-binding Zn-ribbon protein